MTFIEDIMSSHQSPSQNLEAAPETAEYALGGRPALPTGQSRVLGLLCHETAAAWSGLLDPLLPGGVQVQALTNGESYGDRPVAAVLEFHASPVVFTGLLCVELPLAFALVECALGASAITEPPDRGLTPLEGGILRRLLAPLVESFAQQWHRLAPVEFVPTDFRGREELDHVLARTPTQVCPFRVRTPGLSGHLWIGLPLTQAEPLLRKLSLEAWVSEVVSQEDHPQILSVLEESRMSVRAVLGSVSLTLGEISKLTVGSLVFLPGVDEESVTILVGDRPKFTGKVRRHQGRLVVELG